MNRDNESERSASKKSRKLFDSARQIIPGGVSRNTIFREPHPNYADCGSGCHVTDIDGTVRVDFANNMASLIHGHAHPTIVDAVTSQLRRGTAFTMATEAEFRLAKTLCDRVPWFDKIRFMNSGTEAVMAAIKCARAVTGRPMIAKAEGTYHGTYDYAEVSQNASPDQWGDIDNPATVPVAVGTPDSALDDVVIFPFNDVQRSIELLDRHAGKLACILIDLVPHRAGLIPATSQFINALRDWSNEHDVLLIFDEVITFRMAYSGAAEWYDVEPDLTTLGKIIGGGFPVGALAGKEQFMSAMDPLKGKLRFPFSGTFSANPVTMTAGQIAMELFDRQAVSHINSLGDMARKKIAEVIEDTGASTSVTGAGSMFRIHPMAEKPIEYRSAWQNATQKAFTKSLVDHLYHQGFMMFRTCTAALSTATTEKEIIEFTESLRTGLKRLL